MQKNIKAAMFTATMFFAACGASTDGGKNTLTEKKTELETLKAQQQKLSGDITLLEAEIAKLDSTAVKTEKTKLVSVLPIVPINFTHYIDLQGSIASEDISYVSPRNGQGGLVKSLNVKKGDFVKKGQLLVKMDDALILKSLDQLNTQLSYAKDLYRRQKNLWDQQIGTELQLIQAKQNVDQLDGQIATLKEQWSMTNIYADVSGIADQVNVRVGEFFTGYIGQSPQISIVNNSRLKVIIQVPEIYLDKVKKGTNIIVTLPDNGKTFNTTASVSGNLIDPNSRSFYVEGKLPADNSLRPNQVAVVKIQDYSAVNAITIPVNTLQTDEKGKFVMVAVAENGKAVARKKQIVIGQLYGENIEVVSGLQSGDKIVNEGYQGLFDGQVITTNSVK